MGWLRRLFGGDEQRQVEAAPPATGPTGPRPAPPPVRQPEPVPPPLPPGVGPIRLARATERRYAREDCPYCTVALAKLPKAKTACRSCGRPIFVRTGSADGVTYLLREEELGDFDARMDELQDERAEREATALRAAGFLSGDWPVEVVGESHYQDELRRIVGHLKGDVAVPVVARLTREPDNPNDPDAVRVLIGGATVGYLSRTDAEVAQLLLLELERTGRPAWIRGTITGGWRPDRDRPFFGVIVDDLPEPPD